MLNSILCLLMFASGATMQVDTFKKEMAPLQGAVDSVMGAAGARVMSESKATYLDGYGVVVTLQVVLEQSPQSFYPEPRPPPKSALPWISAGKISKTRFPIC